jgi:hypothetical protein
MIQVPFAGVIVAVLALNGCKDSGKAPSATPGAGPTPTAAATGDGRKPCTLMTAAEIEAAIGTPVTKATDYGGLECRWTVKPLASHASEVDPWIAVSFHNDRAMNEVEVAPGTKGVVAVAGLGDRAYRTNVYRHLWVKKGNDVFVTKSKLTGFETTDATFAVTDDIEVRLARLVLTKL